MIINVIIFLILPAWPQNHAGETALHYAARVNKQNANYKAGDDREMANLLLTNGAQLMVTTAKVRGRGSGHTERNGSIHKTVLIS